MGLAPFKSKKVIREPDFQNQMNIYFKDSTRVCAIFPYKSTRSDEMSFDQGEKFDAVIENEKEWWLAKKVYNFATSENVKYIPRNKFVLETDSKRVLESLHYINGNEATQRLMAPHLPPGTFLLRPCSDQQNVVLSVSCVKNSIKSVKNYRILFENNKYFIENNKVFTNLNDLLKYYSDVRVQGLCCPLTQCLLQSQSQTDGYFPLHTIEIDRRRLIMGKKLGCGNFGEVFEAKLDDYVTVAVKKLHHSSVSNKQNLIKEAKSMQKLNHPKIVKLLGVCTEPANQSALIITEFVAKGSLKDYFDKNQSVDLSFKHIITILKDITEAMAYLESKSFIHCDLRAANILVTENFTVKVADFGLSRILDDIYLSFKETENEEKFPIRWMAIEVVKDKKFCLKSDVWSFGMLMYEIVTHGDEPFPELDISEVALKIKTGYKMSKPQNCCDQYYRIMTECWKTHKQRPLFSNLFKTFDDWLKSLD